MKDHAVLEWRAGLPYSTRFEDIYFSVSPQHPQHGLAESRHVFLQHNQLAERWQALPADRPSHFIIVETGFGSGLNFLAAMQLWQQTAPAHAHLHFVSVEIAPFSPQDLQRAHAHFGELSEYSQALCDQYRVLQSGFNQIELAQYRVSLTLFVGSAADYLPHIQFPVDAWFLDGFAPAKNPDMWQDYLFEAMAAHAHAHAGTTFATFTCAGVVKRGLQAAGFHVDKVTGYGAKREMLRGHWPASCQPQSLPPLPRVAVIGAGIAGCSTAWFLAQLGCNVSLFEREAQVAMGASGNPRGMLYPRLNAEKALNDQLALRAYSYSLRHYRGLLASEHFADCGVLQLGASPREFKRVHKVFARYVDTGLMQLLHTDAASSVAGVQIAHDCLYFADGAWVSPQAACLAMLQSPRIQHHCQHTVQGITHTAQGWQLSVNAQQATDNFDAVVVCTAADARQLFADSGMQLNPVRGQMGMVATQSDWGNLHTVLCGDGYVTPSHDGMHTLGATFAPGDTLCDVRQADNEANLHMLASLSPQFADAPSAQVLYARASLRCGSPDYLPYVGPLLNTATLANIALPASHDDLPAANGLYVHVAHGSKGLMTAPFCAAMLARRLLAAHGLRLPQLSGDAFWHGLHPQRLLFKQYGWKTLWQPFHGERSSL